MPDRRLAPLIVARQHTKRRGGVWCVWTTPAQQGGGHHSACAKTSARVHTLSIETAHKQHTHKQHTTVHKAQLAAACTDTASAACCHLDFVGRSALGNPKLKALRSPEARLTPVSPTPAPLLLERERERDLCACKRCVATWSTTTTIIIIIHKPKDDVTIATHNVCNACVSFPARSGGILMSARRGTARTSLMEKPQRGPRACLRQFGSMQ